MASLRVLAAAVAALVPAVALHAQVVRVWDAPIADDTPAARPADVAELLDDAGLDAATIATDHLLDPDALAPGDVALLVMPAAGVYPEDAMAALQDYLTAGGAVLTLGGAPFSRPLARSAGGWLAASVPDEPPGEVRVVADFDGVLPMPIRVNGGEDGPIAWEVAATEDGHCLRATIDDLQQWQYVVLPVADTGDERFTVLRFRARADDNTPLLGIEPNEHDGSRWKMVLPLATEWREYRVFIPHFISYATEGRGGEGDYLHPERLATLGLGFTRGMVGEGPHTLWIDDIERWEFTPPSRDAVPRDAGVIAATAAAYGAGDHLKLPADYQAPLVALFADGERLPPAELRAAGEAGIVPDGLVLAGEWSAWAPRVPDDTGPAYRAVAMSKARTARVAPVLAAYRGEERLGPAAVVVHVHGGELAGARCGALMIDGRDLLQAPDTAEVVIAMADYLTRRPQITSLSPSFGVADGGAVMTLAAHLRGPAQACGATVRFAVTDLDGTERWSETRHVELAARASRTVEAAVPAGEFDVAHYRAVVEASAGDAPADREQFEVDTHSLMARLCDFFVEAQDDDGVISGWGFVDHRAARGLLAMYELTGDERYRDTAIRWGDMELRRQREDGGYRMGYGVMDTGEACYVADGGEIAIGIARLLKYVPEDRREAYLQSLRDYFRYRESFRLDDGTIAVGWVFHSKYTAAGGDETLHEPVRSDTSFGFVCGCTLASASAWAVIAGEPEVTTMALRDGQWFLDDELQATSVFGEAAQWAHRFIDDAAIRAGFEQRMRETLVPWVRRNDNWWFAGGGRSAITLSALQYYYTQIEASPEALAEIMSGVYHMVSAHSPSSLQEILEAGSPDAAEWKYICYSSVSLAEVLEPLITMRDIAGR